jgi:hypothetical protein
MNRARLIQEIQETKSALEKLLALLERDRFVSHLYQSKEGISADV